MLTRRTLWSVLVSALAAVPAMQGLRGASPAVAAADRDAPVPAAAADLRTETAPLPEQRRELADASVRDEHDDAPAPGAAVAFAVAPSHPLFSAVDRTARGIPAHDADLAPTARRALGRPRVRAPDVTARI